jgi:hypothetical protein
MIEPKIDMKEWYSIKNELIELLTKAADQLDKRHIEVCYIRIVGNTVSSVGGGMLIAGLVLAPLSAGTSLPLLAVTGGLIGCLGNTTSITGVIYEKVAERKELDITRKLIEKFNHNTETLLSREASLYWNFINLISPCMSTYNALNVCVKFFQFFDSISDTAEATGAIFTNALVAAGLSGRIFGKFALHVSLVLNLIGIAIDTLDTVIAAKDIYFVADTSNKPSQKLRQFILKFQKLKFEEIESRFVKFNGGVSVVNRGFFSARFNVTYYIDDNKVTALATESFGRKKTITKEFLVPKAAQKAFLKIEILVFGTGCNLKSNVWRKLFKEEIQLPFFKVYKLSGSILNTKIREIKIKNNLQRK